MSQPDTPNGAPELTDMSSVKLALMARQLRAQAGALARAEPIAVIGMGCRFPGGVDTLDRYWRVIADGVDAVGPLPRDRFDVDAIFDPDPATPGKMSVTAGGFVDGVDRFDAGFFGIIGREAQTMDPQHRMFLEVAVDALDHAGLSRSQLAGSPTGAFVASYYNDYELLHFADREAIDARTLTGTQHSVLVNRLSYLLDLRGPSVSVNTACSSSLVAVHLACQSLRSGDCDVALAGGVSLMLTEDLMVTLSKVGFMSPSGRCFTFDAAADGFIRGEGCGVVVLKRLADAVADGDRVLAVIRGSAVNQDGHSTVLTAPNGLAQQALVADALATAQVRPERVGYVETHGTATPIGDPIEVEALAAVVGAASADAGPCHLGSVKSNIGHLEAAAGVAGLIKAVLVLEHAEIPPQAGFTRLNPHISLDGTRLRIATERTPWTATAWPRVAGVSGFGVGGTNAHVVVEEAPALPAPEPRPVRAELLTLSAQAPEALRELAEAWREVLADTGEPAADLCAAAAVKRSHYTHRLALVGATADELRRGLDGFLAGTGTAAIGRRASGGRAAIPFVFSGQGSQWPGMVTELAASEPVVADTLADLDARFREHGDWSLLEALAAPDDSSRLDATEVAQPAIFAVQVALAELLASWGVRPTGVIGHSVGELAAFHVAGVLDRAEAVRIVWQRGRIMQRATGLGRMTAVALSAGDADRFAADTGGDLSVAAVNGPRAVVLAGSVDAIDEGERRLTERGVSFRRLPVSYAFHSAQMEPFRDELVAALGTVTARAPRVPVYSTVTGARLAAGDVDAAYFGRNIRATVRFADALGAALAAGADAVLEVAPHAVLAGAIAECAAARASDDADPDELPIAVAMRRGQPQRAAVLAAAGRLYTVGADLEWPAVFPGTVRTLDLPGYPWQRQSYWLAGRTFGRGADPLLGAPAEPAADGTHTFVAERATAQAPWLADHTIGGATVMPATGLLAIFRAAALASGAGASVENLVIHEPLVVDGADDGWRTSIGAADPTEPGRRAAIWSRSPGQPDRCIAEARLGAPVPDAPPVAPPSRSPGRDGGGWVADPDSLYAALAELGASFGPAFRTVTRWRPGPDDTAEAWLTAPPGAPADHRLPGLLDGALQTCLLAAATGAVPRELMLPLAVDRFDVVTATIPAELHAVARVRARGERTLTADVELSDGSAQLVARITGVRLASAGRDALVALGRRPAPVYDPTWVVDEPLATPVPAPMVAGTWIVLSSGPGGDAIAGLLTEAGHTARLVRIDGTDDDAVRAALTGADDVRGVIHATALDDLSDEPDGRGRRVLGTALQLIQAADAMGSATMWWLTRGAQPVGGTVSDPEAAALWGLASVAERELPDLDLRLLDLAPHPVAGVVDLLVGADTPPRVALRGIARWVPRVLPHRGEARVAGDVALRVDPAGTLDAIEWEPAAPAAPGPGEVRVRVRAAGLNFRDVLLALGAYPGGEAALGVECAGVVDALGDGVDDLVLGQRVFGYAPHSLATHVVVPAHSLRPVPPTMSSDEAAALPIAHLTARYGLGRLAGLRRGQWVLIHAAAGGVGLAAVEYARSIGAEVIATVGSPAKRRLLEAIGVTTISDSRSPAFVADTLAATGGRGVDVVLNSLSAELIDASVSVLADGGCFLELGKRDVWSGERMATQRPDVRYHVFDLGAEAAADPTLVREMLDDLLADWHAGRLRPLPIRVFEPGEVAGALRTMAHADHVGKLVVRFPAAAPADVVADCTYLVTGGTSGIGLLTAQWLAARGARHLMLTGRSAPSPDAQSAIAALEAAGVNVAVRAADAGDADAVAATLAEIGAAWPPLRGIVHAAGIHDDGPLLQQTYARCAAVLAGKAGGAALLDGSVGDELDFFVVYSAGGLLLGAPGQGPYAAANAQLDGIAWMRRGRGAHALSVAWGPWAQAGMAARLRDSGDTSWERRGVGWLGTPAAFDALERLLADGSTSATVMPVDWRRFLAGLPPAADTSRYASVAPTRSDAAAAEGGGRRAAGAPVAAWRAAPAADRRRLVIQYVAEQARHVIGLDPGYRFDERAALKESGLDSLMAVELRNVLTRSLGANLPATLLFDYPSLDQLAGYLGERFELGPYHAPVVADGVEEDGSMSAAVGAHRDVVGLSDAEAEALLLAELGDPGAGR